MGDLSIQISTAKGGIANMKMAIEQLFATVTAQYRNITSQNEVCSIGANDLERKIERESK